MAKKKGTIKRSWTCPKCTKHFLFKQDYDDTYTIWGSKKDNATKAVEQKLARAKLDHATRCAGPILGTVSRSWTCRKCGQRFPVKTEFDRNKGIFSSKHRSEEDAQQAAESAIAALRSEHESACPAASGGRGPTSDRGSGRTAAVPPSSEKVPSDSPAEHTAPGPRASCLMGCLGAVAGALALLMTIPTLISLVAYMGWMKWEETTSPLCSAACWGVPTLVLMLISASLLSGRSRPSAEDPGASPDAPTEDHPEPAPSATAKPPASPQPVHLQPGSDAAKAITTLFVYVAKADRRFTASEVEVIAKTAQVPPDVDLEAMLKAIKPTPELVQAAFATLAPLAEDVRRAVLTQAQRIAEADGSVTAKERERLDEIAEQLGLSP